MYKEVKFRGQRIDNNEWIFGFYVKDPKGQHRIYWQPFDDASSNTYHFVKPETIGQFTGIKDMKSKDVYANDICRSDGFNLIVKFINNYKLEVGRNENDGEIYYSIISGWFGEFTDKSGYTTLAELEVIGNIYESPELLQNVA